MDVHSQKLHCYWARPKECIGNSNSNNNNNNNNNNNKGMYTTLAVSSTLHAVCTAPM